MFSLVFITALLLPIAALKLPTWPDQFRMDVRIAKSDNMKEIKVNGYGTVYYDHSERQSASLMHWGQPENLVVIKQVIRNNTVYTVDLATGECRRRSVQNADFVHGPYFLHDAKYSGDGFVRRGLRWFHVSRWSVHYDYNVPFGGLVVDIEYQHTTDLYPNVPVRAVYRDSFCPFLMPRFPSQSMSWKYDHEGRDGKILNNDDDESNDPCNSGVGMHRIIAVDYSSWVLGLDDIDKKSVFDVPVLCPMERH